jgi:hypothetical protein
MLVQNVATTKVQFIFSSNSTSQMLAVGRKILFEYCIGLVMPPEYSD